MQAGELPLRFLTSVANRKKKLYFLFLYVGRGRRTKLTTKQNLKKTSPFFFGGGLIIIKVTWSDDIILFFLSPTWNTLNFFFLAFMVVCIPIIAYWLSSDFGNDHRNVGNLCVKTDEKTEIYNEDLEKILKELDDGATGTSTGSTMKDEDDKNEPFTLIAGFKDIGENLNFDKINEFSEPRPFLLRTTYFTDRNELLEKQLSKDPTSSTILSFWSDKVRTKQCCHTSETPFTPHICTFIVVNDIYNPTSFNNRFTKCQNKIQLTEGGPDSFVIKPNHLTITTGVYLETKEVLLKKTVKEQINDLTKFGLYRLNKAEQTTYIKDAKLEVDVGGSRRGILIQPRIANEKLTHIGEIRLSIVFGRVEVIQYGTSFDANKTCTLKKEVMAQSYRFGDNFKPILADKTTHGDDWAVEFNEMQKKCWKLFEDGVNWQSMIAIIDHLGRKLHMDYVRIDVFPRTKDTFYINEIEVNNGLRIIDYKTHIIKKLEEGWQNVNKKSEENFNSNFISVEEAKKDFNDNCFAD